MEAVIEPTASPSHGPKEHSETHPKPTVDLTGFFVLRLNGRQLTLIGKALQGEIPQQHEEIAKELNMQILDQTAASVGNYNEVWQSIKQHHDEKALS